VNSFAETKVKKQSAIHLTAGKWSVHLRSLGRSACRRWIYDRSCDARLVHSQTYGYLPRAEHCNCPL